MNKSLDGIQNRDGTAADQGVHEVLAILKKHPDAGRGDPGPGHNLAWQFWMSCGDDCGGWFSGSGTSWIWGPAVYAVCYSSCVAASW